LWWLSKWQLVVAEQTTELVVAEQIAEFVVAEQTTELVVAEQTTVLVVAEPVEATTNYCATIIRCVITASFCKLRRRKKYIPGGKADMSMLPLLTCVFSTVRPVMSMASAAN
jgi:hypothetical protein